MDTRDIYKLVREFEEEKDDVINLYDSLDIELSGDFVIETGIVGFTEDGVIVHLDEDAMEFLDFNGVLLESEEQINEDNESIDAVYNAVLNRITRQHLEVLSKFGPAAVQAAIEDVAEVAGSGGLEEIGSSDVSIWTKQVIQDLEAGHYKNLHEGGYSAVDAFKNKLSKSNDPFEMVYNAISGDYGEEIRDAFQEMYDDIVNDSGYRLHPDDDFEKIINLIVDQFEDNTDHHRFDVVESDELNTIKKLALGESAEELDEGLGKALLAGAALIASIAGINKMQADHLMKTQPQLVTLTQMRQEAVQAGDEYKVKEIDERIKKTLDFIRVKGRPVMGPDGPVDPREPVGEAEYQGRKVPLGKPMKGDVKKSKVYVKKPNGKVVKVNFGDKNMRIKKSNPARRKSFRARHNCDNPGPRWKARYWSCRAW